MGIDEDYITRRILELDQKKNWEMDYHITFRQLSLFDDSLAVSIQKEKS